MARLRRGLLTFLVGSLSSAPGIARACGALTLSSNAITVNWSESYSSQTETLTVSRSNNSACNFLISFTKGGGPSYIARRAAYLTHTLPYQIYSSSSLSASTILKDFPAATSNSNVVRGNFSSGSGGGSSKSANYWFEIPYSSATSPTLAKAGTYTDTFQAKLWKGTLSSHGSSPHDTDSISVSVVVPAILRLSLVSTGAGFNSADTTETVDFGDLTVGESQSFDVRTVTNSGYALSVSSANNGVLKHASPSVATTIPYVFKVAGTTYGLSTSATTPVQVASVAGATSLNGDAKSVTIEIGDVSEKIAGAYSDTILVTATTTE